MPIQDADQYGDFLQTTQIWDIANLDKLSDGNLKVDDFKEIMVRLYQQIGNISTTVNKKETGQFQVSEFVTGQLYFSNPSLSSSSLQYPEDRAVIRKVINFGALPNAGVKSVAHGITCTVMTSFTHIYGTATDPVGFNYVPIPYASNAAATDMIELYVDGTNVNINTGTIDRSNFTITYIVLEYIQT